MKRFAARPEWEKEHMSEHESREPDPEERGEDEEVKREGASNSTPDEGGNPWAKTSSGDKENVTSDDAD